jgi:4-hydroxyphenylacetate 3-monooxygenase
MTNIAKDQGRATDSGTKALGSGAMDGARYLESLRDGREVWLNGERVKDVTTHAAFAPVARELARVYDLQHAPETRDQMTFVNENGVRVSYSYLMPRSPEDLLKRKRNAQIWAGESFGMMGRYPDFCASMAVGFNDVRDELVTINPQFARAAAFHHQWASENDLCLGHGLHDPTMDKSLRPEQDPDRCLRIVRERDDGIVVRGARFVTLGPLCNELQVAPTYPLNERETDFGLWFTIPASAPGVRQICREPFTLNRTRTDHPASARFDEQDALVIFDDVLIPWERVMLARQPIAAGRLLRSRVMTWAVYAAAIQLLARLELLIGTAHLLAETCGMESRPNVQQLLGELITYARIFQSIVRAAEVDCVTTAGGHVAPGQMMHQRAFAAMISERLVTILEHVGTSSLVFQPMKKDLDVPELAEVVERYYGGRGISTADRIKLCKLARELTCDSFGGRQQLYERLHSGEPGAIMAGVYQQYDKARAVEMVRRLLEIA